MITAPAQGICIAWLKTFNFVKNKRMGLKPEYENRKESQKFQNVDENYWCLHQISHGKFVPKYLMESNNE